MKKIIFVFLIYGVATGLISVWFGQNTDTLFLFNIPGTLIGDTVYGLSIKLLGNPHSPQAHYTIPWILRVPQVYILTSIVFWGLIGSMIQLIYKKIKK